MTATVATQVKTPRSYLSAEERDQLYREGGVNLVYLAESQDAGRAGDEDAAWAWLAMAELPASTLRGLKRRRGAQFIRDLGFNTRTADEAYGAGWLDRE